MAIGCKEIFQEAGISIEVEVCEASVANLCSDSVSDSDSDSDLTGQISNKFNKCDGWLYGGVDPYLGSVNEALFKYLP